MLDNATDTDASESVRSLVEVYDGLEWNKNGKLDSGEYHLFVEASHDRDVKPPSTLPSIAHEDSIYFLVPSDFDFPGRWDKRKSLYLLANVAREGEAFFPESGDYQSDEEIKSELERHERAVSDARHVREARETLEKASSDLYASAAWIDDETPMLVEGLMRERGVSVFYGAFDEFKTTLVLDIMAHVACGADWQGRKVEPRPVIWYALEGADEIPVRLRALEGRLRKMDTPWGDAPLPIAVRDRIPDDYIGWRTELNRLVWRWNNVLYAREYLTDLPGEKVTLHCTSGKALTSFSPPYPNIQPLQGLSLPVVVIDTLSLALGGDDEKGPRAAGIIKDCLDLLKEWPELKPPAAVWCGGNEEAEAQWLLDNPGRDPHDWLHCATASQVIIIHHQTKTGVDFAGHRAIAANTQGLYRIHRFGKFTDPERPYAGQLTPSRVKGIPRPAPIRFEVEVVPVEGTKQTAAVVKNKAADIPAGLRPVVAALRELDDHDEISRAALNDCLDTVAAKGSKSENAKRQARKRVREQLEAFGVIELVENEETGRVEFYRFHGVMD